MPRNIISQKEAQGCIGQCRAMGGIEGYLWRARIAGRIAEKRKKTNEDSGHCMKPRHLQQGTSEEDYDGQWESEKFTV